MAAHPIDPRLHHNSRSLLSPQALDIPLDLRRACSQHGDAL